MYESINTTVCVKLNNIQDPSLIQMLFQECSNHLEEHNQPTSGSEIDSNPQKSALILWMSL